MQLTIGYNWRLDTTKGRTWQDFGKRSHLGESGQFGQRSRFCESGRFGKRSHFGESCHIVKTLPFDVLSLGSWLFDGKHINGNFLRLIRRMTRDGYSSRLEASGRHSSISSKRQSQSPPQRQIYSDSRFIVKV
jgi:hypothetical protein